VVDEDRGIIIPDVGQPSAIEIYEASVIEQSCAAETGIGARPIEIHPDWHKKDGSDGREADYGRTMMDREGQDGDKIGELSEEAQLRAAAEAPRVYVSGIQRKIGVSEIEINLGYNGNWLISQFPIWSAV
jgi:hypothetical protein